MADWVFEEKRAETPQKQTPTGTGSGVGDPNPYPPTSDQGRWQKAANGSWVENPGYTGVKSPIPAGYASYQRNGQISYGNASTQADAPGTNAAPAYSESAWQAMRDSDYDTQLTSRLLAQYSKANAGNQYGAMAGNPAIIQTAKRQPGESLNTWMQRLNSTFPGIAFRSTTGQWRDAGGAIESDPRAMEYINFDSAVDANGLNVGQRMVEKENAEKAATKQAIADFAAELQKPLDISHPEAQRLVKIVGQSTSDQARLRGIEGPLSVANTEQATATAIAGLNEQRKDRGLQATMYQDRSQLAAGQLANQIANQNYEKAYQGWNDKTGLASMDEFKDTGTGRGVGSGIGGGIGMAIGSLIPGVGTLIGGTIGSAFGGTIGGAFERGAHNPGGSAYNGSIGYNSYTPPPRRGY